MYTRYADLYDRYAQAEGLARQAAFEVLIRHTYRMRATMMVHAKALYRDLAARDKRVIDSGRGAVERARGPQPVEIQRAVHAGRAAPVLGRRNRDASVWSNWILNRSNSATIWFRPSR